MTKDVWKEFLVVKHRIDKAIEALCAGKGIILIDDERRENEGDLIFAAEKMTKEDMALMIRSCSGIVCLCITEEKAKQLQLPLMVADNTSRYGTNFTVSVEAAEGVTTGVSASDRIQTIRTAIAEDCLPKHLSRPGHVFPLIARNDGVLEREGHTEGSVDLMRLAGLKPCAVLCELQNSDGTMSRMPELSEFSAIYGFPIVSVQDIIFYRTHRNSIKYTS